MNNGYLGPYLQLVADPLRRELLAQLRREVDGETSIDDLVDRLHGNGPVLADDPRRDRELLAIQLYHSHLPKLAGHSIVEYDRERGTVEYLPDERLETVLDSLPDGVSRTCP